VGAIDVGFATVVIIAALGVIHTKSITLWGFEILTERHGDSWQAAALFDIEADLWFNVTIGSTTLLSLPPQKAMKVRYKAVGVRFGENDGQMVLAVAFDPSRGYELSAPDASAIQMPAPLGEILHLLAIRMARINPFQIEADIGLKADLGVVSVERARVRLTLPENDGEQLAVTITALAASVNIPGALKGSGSLAIDDTGFDGSLDLALTSLGLRIAATLSVRQIDDATSGRSLTAVYASLEVDFPAPLPLLQSGLGIYGFIGLFGMHYGRTQDPPTSPDDNPALDWLNKAAPTAEINKITGPPPANNVLWAPQPDHWAVGLGVVLGTMDGGTILNLQGVVIVELPGPRIVIFVKAKFLEPKPATNSQVSATITALIEIDPDEILIGIIVEYDELAPLLKLRVPVGAFFQFSNPQNFHIDVGTFHAPATAKVLDLFDATAFVEIHGDQIDDVDPLVQQLGGPLPGLAIAAGIHAAIVWGDRSSGLYLEVTARSSALASARSSSWASSRCAARCICGSSRSKRAPNSTSARSPPTGTRISGSPAKCAARLTSCFSASRDVCTSNSAPPASSRTRRHWLPASRCRRAPPRPCTARLPPTVRSTRHSPRPAPTQTTPALPRPRRGRCRSTQSRCCRCRRRRC
jgi:hypothetical protein